MWQGKQSSPGDEPDTALHTRLRRDSLKVMQAKKVNCKVGLLGLVEGPEERLSWVYLGPNHKC